MAISVLGGAADHTATDVVGDVPARLYAMRLYGASAGTLTRKYWIGFRSDNKVNGPQNFTALWELEGGTANTDTSVTTDALASPGGGGNTKMLCTFATTPTVWHLKCSLSWETITSNANYDDFAGQFVILLRAKMDTGTAQVKLDNSFGGGLTRVFGPVVDIAATDYTIYNLGVITYPLRDVRALSTALLADTYDHPQRVAIWARRKTGSTAALSLDCLVAIPCDEYFVYVDYAEVADGVDCYIGASPEDTWQGGAVIVAQSQFSELPEVSIQGAGVPTGDGRFWACCAATADAAPVLAKTHSMSVQLFPRYGSLVGAE